jgi:hypothetical protein
MGQDGERYSPAEGARRLAGRVTCTPTLRLMLICPADTRLWAALQNISGGIWRGCVYDVDKIIERLGGNSHAAP